MHTHTRIARNFKSLISEGRGQVQDEGGEGADSANGEEESAEVSGGLCVLGERKRSELC